VLGTSPTLAPLLLPGCVARARTECPSVTLKVVEEFSSQLFDDLLSAQVDVAVLTNPPHSRSLAMSPLLAEPIVVFAGAADRGMKRGYSLTELRRTPVIDRRSARWSIGSSRAGAARDRGDRPGRGDPPDVSWRRRHRCWSRLPRRYRPQVRRVSDRGRQPALHAGARARRLPRRRGRGAGLSDQIDRLAAEVFPRLRQDASGSAPVGDRRHRSGITGSRRYDARLPPVQIVLVPEL
jgi:DNA-binding transcriptional LysR family regulator